MTSPAAANKKVQELIDRLGASMSKDDYQAFLEWIECDLQSKLDCVWDELGKD